MLGRKSRTISGVLRDRVRRIAEAPSTAPAGPQKAVFGKRPPRAPAFRPAQLTFMHGERLDVVVKDLNAAGARIEFVRGTGLPERVLLTEPRQGLRKWAHVTWQAWGVAGLAFVEPDAEIAKDQGAAGSTSPRFSR